MDHQEKQNLMKLEYLRHKIAKQMLCLQFASYWYQFICRTDSEQNENNKVNKIENDSYSQFESNFVIAKKTTGT